jgi:hypothetical protein
VIGRASFSVLGLALVVASCRFSASAADPYADPPSAASGSQGTGGSMNTGGSGDTGGMNGASGTEGMNGASGTEGMNGASGTEGTNGASGSGGASGATGGSTGTDSGTGGDTGSEGTGGSDAGMSCQPATPPAICDPVKNLGCLVPFSFCDIDPAQAVATGRCVFPWSLTPPPTDGGCLADMTSSSCMPMSTCAGGSCKKICYCDSDCPVGQCCTQPAPGSSTAFKLCAPC